MTTIWIGIAIVSLGLAAWQSMLRFKAEATREEVIAETRMRYVQKLHQARCDERNARMNGLLAWRCISCIQRELPNAQTEPGAFDSTVALVKIIAHMLRLNEEMAEHRRQSIGEAADDVSKATPE